MRGHADLWRKPFCRAVRAGVIVAVCLCVPACGSPTIQGRWKDREIKIDGDYRDWESSLYHFEDAGIYAGVLRDETYLYLCVSSSDPARVRQALHGGLTVWFDATGGRKKSLGIRFPVGAPGPAGERPPRTGPGSEPADSHGLLERFTGAQREIELLRDSSAPQRMLVADAAGFDVQIGLVDDVLTYELRIPLVASPESLCAIAASPVPMISVGLMTTAFGGRRPRRPGDSDSSGGRSGRGGPSRDRGDGGLGGPPGGGPRYQGEPSGDWGGGGGGRGSGRGSDGPRGGRPRGDVAPNRGGPLELWFRVALPSGAQK